MKKFTIKTLAVTLMFVCAAILSSCSCSRDKDDLFSCVPADTAGVAVIDLTNLWEQLEIKVDGDDMSYCSEIKELLKFANVKSKDLHEVEEVLRMFEGTAKTVVVFEHEDNIWGTFCVEDSDDFIKLLEDEGDADFDKEDGFKVWESIAVKGDQVWFCINTKDPKKGIDTEELKELYKLDKDKRFNKKYEKITEYLLAENVTSAYCINIEKCLDYCGSSDRQMANMALSMAFDGAKFLVGQSKLTDKEMTSEVRVLNDKQDPAKFLLPMAKIEAAGLSKLNNDSPLVVAVAVSPELTQKIKGVVEKLNGGLNTYDQEVFSILGAISGTSGLSFASASDCVAVVNFDNPNTPSQIGSMLSGDAPFEFSTAGNALIARLPGTSTAGSGKAPSKLVGQYAGIYIDGGKEGGKLIKGYDLSKLGSMWMTIGPDGDGIKIESGWSLKNPMRTLLKEILEISKGVATNEITAPGLEEFEDKYLTKRCEEAADTTYSYDDYYYGEMEAPVTEAAAPVEEAPAEAAW